MCRFCCIRCYRNNLWLIYTSWDCYAEFTWHSSVLRKELIGILRKSRLPLFRRRKSILFCDSRPARTRDRSTGARFSAERTVRRPRCVWPKRIPSREKRERKRKKSMKKRKMLIGTACSVQQRVLTRLPGTWRAFSPLLPFVFSVSQPSRTNTLQQTLPARCRHSSKRGVLSKLERDAICDAIWDGVPVPGITH